MYAVGTVMSIIIMIDVVNADTHLYFRNFFIHLYTG